MLQVLCAEECWNGPGFFPPETAEPEISCETRPDDVHMGPGASDVYPMSEEDESDDKYIEQLQPVVRAQCPGGPDNAPNSMT